MLPEVVFGLTLVGLSIYLLRMHRGERAELEANSPDRKLRREGLANVRRRSLASGLIGLAGIMVTAGVLIKSTVALAIYWSIALIVVGLIITLGLIDFARSRKYLRALQAEHQKERAALEAEVKQHLDRRNRDDE